MLISTIALGCAPTRNTIRIAPAATADSLVLVLRSTIDSGLPPESVYGLSVLRCDTRDVAWTISADGSRRMPGDVVYGRPVPGFPTRVGPLPLVPGCYEVIVSNAASRRFDVDANRAIHMREYARPP
jgi:hypothetical protein